MIADATTPPPARARADGDPTSSSVSPLAMSQHAARSTQHLGALGTQHSALGTSGDRAIFDALDTPGSVIDPFFFAEWSARPEIRAALAARDLLRHNAERLRAEAVRDEALEDARYARAALRHVIDTARAALGVAPSAQPVGGTPSLVAVATERGSRGESGVPEQRGTPDTPSSSPRHAPSAASPSSHTTRGGPDAGAADAASASSPGPEPRVADTTSPAAVGDPSPGGAPAVAAHHAPPQRPGPSDHIAARHALSELRRAATSLGRLAAISRALVDRPAIAVRALAAITTRVHARAAAPSFPTSPLPHSPTQPSATPASSLSSPEPVTAAFLDALRRDPDAALPFVAGYRIRAQSQAALRHWLLTARAMLARAGAPGPARIDDKTDTALQHITAAPDDPADPPARLVIKAVLERNARGEHRWCIADVTRAADTS